jgi:hypothetical protein|tara:strand:- start:400 stop:873 length:474 start_codon:yes stop_codon:yes gene_type:complete
MSLKYTTGARTRNVVNIAVPGGTTPAYSLTAANTVPAAAGDGFRNFNTQRMLHVLVHNNSLDNGGSTPVAIAASKITIYGYNSSLGGKWAPIRLNDRASGAETAVFPPVTIPDSIAKDTFYRLAIPIEGVERIAVYVEAIPTRTAGSLDIYLGVNSI